MNRKELAIQKAKKHLHTISDVVHDISHMETVWGYCQELAKDNKDIDLEALEIATWWHDVGRIHDNKTHPTHSAKMVRDELAKLGYSKDYVEFVASIVEDHPSSKSPRSAEGTILRDADKLDFLSTNRWGLVVDNEKYKSTQDAIDKIPNIKYKVLNLERSRKIYDRLFLELQEYAKSVKKTSFRDFRKQILDMKIPKE